MSEQKPIVWLIDDSKEYTSLLSYGLNDIGEVHCPSTFQNAEEAILSLREAFQKPNLILLDLQMPGLGGLDAIPVIHTMSPSTCIIIVSGSCDPQDIEIALQRGASGYTLKDWSTEDIVEAIHDALNGELPLDPLVSRKLFERRQSIKLTASPHSLTVREQEILKLLLDSRTVPDIADSLAMTSGTVRWHIKQLHAKFGTHRRSHLVLKALNDKAQ